MVVYFRRYPPSFVVGPAKAREECPDPFSLKVLSNKKIRVLHGSTTCAPTLIPILRSWKPKVGPLFSGWDPNRRRNHDLDPTLCPNFALQITCQLLTVELANFAPNFVQVGEQVGVEFGIKVGTKLAYCETP